MESPATTARDRWLRLALVLLVALAVAGFYLGGLHERLRWEVIRGQVAAWQAVVRENLAVAVPVFFLVYVACTALSLPTSLALSLLAGALFDRWLGVAVVSLAATCGASLAFLGSRYLLRDWVRRHFGPRLAAVDRGIERDGAWYLLMLRLNPAVPYFLINVAMALTPMRLGTFALVSWVGMLPGALVYVNAGSAIGSIEDPSDVLSPAVVVSLALLGVVPLALRLLLRRWSSAP